MVMQLPFLGVASCFFTASDSEYGYICGWCYYYYYYYYYY
jgi:hypothetical protein